MISHPLILIISYLLCNERRDNHFTCVAKTFRIKKRDYEHDCLQNYLLLFMSLLAALIVETSHILAEIYFIFLKNVLDPTCKAFNAKFGPQ